MWFIGNKLHRIILRFILISSIIISVGAPITAYADIREDDAVGGVSASETIVVSPDVDAERICVIDTDGNVLFSRNADDECKIASVTKVMTAIIAEEYDPTLTTEITVSASAANTSGSTAYVETGDVLTLEQALIGLLLPSGNDVAIAIAQNIGTLMLVDEGASADGITEEKAEIRFADAMNAKAAELGMDSSYFINACGLDNGSYEGEHHSTASDVVKMTAYAMTLDGIRNTVQLSEADMTVTRNGEEIAITLENTDELLSTDERIIGGKTGYTDAAGRCFTVACNITINNEEKENYITVLGAEYSGSVFDDTTTIVDWLETIYDTIELTGDVSAGEIIGIVAHTNWNDETAFSVGIAEGSYEVSIYSWETSELTQSAEIYEINGDVTAGDEVGVITFTYGDNEVASVPIVALEDCQAPRLLDILWMLFTNIVNTITGQTDNSKETTTSNLTLLTPTSVVLESSDKGDTDINVENTIN